MTAANLVEQLEGMPRLEAVRVIIAALHEVTAGMTAEDLPGIIPIIQRLVPIRKYKTGRFAPVWEYLETIPEYTTQRALRIALVKRFGEQGTPGTAYLSRYLKENRGG